MNYTIIKHEPELTRALDKSPSLTSEEFYARRNWRPDKRANMPLAKVKAFRKLLITQKIPFREIQGAANMLNLDLYTTTDYSFTDVSLFLY